MASKKEVGSRALIDELSNFLRTPTPNQECIVEFINNYIDKGEKSISLFFRGDYATLYYRCRQLLKLEYSNKQVKGFFDFNYARFSPRVEDYRNELSNLGVKFGKNLKNISVILDGNGKVEKQALKQILTKYIELIDCWLAHMHKKTVSEGDRQQQLFAIGFGNSENTYFDIEYREPRETLIKEGYYDYVGLDLEAKKAEYKQHCGGRFDLLGLRRTEEGYVLQFVEVKTKPNACKDPSGVLDHIRDYTKYCNYTNLVNKRKSDAVYTVNLLSEILNKDVWLKVEDIVGHEIVFIFTDDSVKMVEQYRQALDDKNIKIVCYDKNLNRIE